METLVVHPEPGGHRLHRLALALAQQAAHVQLAGGPLVLACQAVEHLCGERRQPGLYLVDLAERQFHRLHNHEWVGPSCSRLTPTRQHQLNLTKYY